MDLSISRGTKPAFARRTFLQSILAGSAAAPFFALPTGCGEDQLQASGGQWWQLDAIGDPVMDNQLLWYLGHCRHGMVDIGECLETATRIAPGDERSWFDAWLATAQRLHAVAEVARSKGHQASAGDAYWRASNYYRAALIHYPRPGDPRLLQATQASVACYEFGLTLLGWPGRAVSIPYEKTALPGYFFTSPVADGPAPTLLVHQGFHAFPEESMWVVAGALRRGYHCLIFHGPGQGLVLRQHSLPFRPDWENVVTPVVDFALTLPEVDPSMLILKGTSMGGALAPRAAAFEKRLAICIANPGVLNWNAAMERQLAAFPGLTSLLATSPEAFNAAVGSIVGKSAAARWWFADATWKHGASSPADLLIKLRDYNNEPWVAQIECNTLVMDGTAEEFSAGEAQRLYDALRCPKSFMLFDEVDTGLVHVQTGALAVAESRMFDWLDEAVQ